MFSNLLSYIPFLVHFCFAIAVHEFAHAYMAYRMGDGTARDQGRLTLNPLAHLDPVGTLCLFFAGFGWGKPVPVDPRNLRNPRRDGLWISAAGPFSNLLLAGIFASGLWAFNAWLIPVSVREESVLVIPWVLATGTLLNLALAFFNLLPIFPLDGEKVIVGLIPGPWVRTADRLRNYGVVVLFVLLASGPVFGFSVFGWFFDWTIYPMFRLIVPSYFKG